MMIDPKRELFKWGPVDGSIVYTDYFMEYFVPFAEYFSTPWPDAINYVKNHRTTVIIDYQNLRDNGERLFRDYVLDEKKCSKIYRLWIGVTKKIEKMLKIVTLEKLGKLNNSQLKKLFNGWDNIHEKFWVYGFLPELSNWGGEQYLKREILKFNKMDFIEIFEGLAAPEGLSFFQKEELELLNIKLMKDRKRAENALKRHQERYFWLRNSYADVKILDVDYFRQELGKITAEEAGRKIREIKEMPKKTKEKKNKLIEKYKISKKIANIGKKLAYCVWWQDFRKKYIFMSNHLIFVFINEFAKRHSMGVEDLRLYNRTDLLNLVNKGIKVKNVRERNNCYFSYYHEKENKLTYSIGKEAEDFIDPYIHMKIDKNIKEIKGIVVSKGKAKGRVKILFTAKESHKMNKGDVLVSPMTSPDYIVAIRKASAIITDEGGMTCHAAIVSRELGVPCIVSTRIATKLLKDGEEVEVDADKGIVRRL